MNRFFAQVRPASWLAVAFCVLGSRSAHAKLCSSDLDCSTGFTCQNVPVGSSDCSACAGPTCPPQQQTCPPPETVRECYPASCNSALDCPSDMICYADTERNCSAPGPGGTIQCTTTVTRHLCVPPWIVPCTSDSSCGPNLTCKKATPVCPAPQPGVTPTCTPVTSAEGQCKAPQIPCGSGTVCPGNWTCEAVTTEGSTACPASGPPGSGGQVTGGCTTTPSTTRMLCVPPYYSEIADIAHEVSVSNDSQGLGMPTVRGMTGTGSGSGDSGGCSMTAREVPSTSAVGLVFLGAAGLLRRRRRAALSGR